MKKYIKLSKKVKVNINSLRKSVNAFDKSFDIKLRKKLSYPKPKKLKNIYKKGAKKYTLTLFAGINNIPLKVFFKKNTKIRKDIPKILNHILDSMSSKSYKIDSYEFRLRFVNNVILYLLSHQNKIIKNLIRKVKHSKNEYYIVKIQEYIRHLYNFPFITLHPTKSHKNSMLNINTYMNYSTNKKHKKIRKVDKYIRRNINNIEDGINGTNIDDIMLVNIFKLSSVLSTNSFYDEYLPNYNSFKHHIYDDNMIKHIKKLGKNIYKAHSLSPLFKIFTAYPISIRTKYRKECTNKYVYIGIVSLLYTKFIIDNKKFNTIIDKILNKPSRRMMPGKIRHEMEKNERKRNKKKKG